MRRQRGSTVRVYLNERGSQRGLTAVGHSRVLRGVAKGSLRRELNLCLYVEAVGTNVRTVMPLDSEGWL